MRQVCIPRYGPPEVLRLQDAPEPPLTPTDVRIAVHASGVNFADVMARQGLYPDCPKPPVVVGYEVAGRVIEAGAEATGVATGQRVVALTRFGGYADQVVVPWRQVFALPGDMPFTDAAALPVNYLTAYLAAVCVRPFANQRARAHPWRRRRGGARRHAALPLARRRNLRHGLRAQARFFAPARRPSHLYV